MNRRMQDMNRKPVSVWTPWGEQKLDRDENGRSRFRRRLELRRERRERSATAPKSGSTRN